ncbi:hypothetical protein VNI00_009582 [Paramarasmius palmivorus]|uniref:Uncharacterized protein n=1 Tax=Paramarasmius palmivorus TaxID=297713 RepID=A0AAW0CRX5_9AGAR
MDGSMNQDCGNRLGFKQKKKVVKNLRRRFRLDGARLSHRSAAASPRRELEIRVDVQEQLSSSGIPGPVNNSMH